RAMTMMNADAGLSDWLAQRQDARPPRPARAVPRPAGARAGPHGAFRGIGLFGALIPRTVPLCRLTE
ncbi:hypothetical protein, partial [Micromonospora globbae]|uniref:hypothetical protein n=1 Tax=Micromonospora globbae TaxID=1894969 RepID=UPI003435CBD9